MLDYRRLSGCPYGSWRVREETVVTARFSTQLSGTDTAICRIPSILRFGAGGLPALAVIAGILPGSVLAAPMISYLKSGPLAPFLPIQLDQC